MKKTTIAAIVACAFAVPHAFAQSEAYKGLSLGLGVNIAKTSTEALLNGASNTGSDNDANVAMQLQYTVALNNVWLLGLGGTANAGDLKAGRLGTNDIKAKNSYALFVAPGYAFGNNWMGYAKLAYLNANTSSSSGGSVNFDAGYGYGLGIQAMLDKHWFAQAEVMVQQYADKTSFNETDKLKANVYSFTAGYKF